MSDDKDYVSPGAFNWVQPSKTSKDAGAADDAANPVVEPENPAATNPAATNPTETNSDATGSDATGADLPPTEPVMEPGWDPIPEPTKPDDWEGEPTELMRIEPEAREAQAAAVAERTPPELIPPPLSPPIHLSHEIPPLDVDIPAGVETKEEEPEEKKDETSAIDSLFAEHKFQEYEDAPVLAQIPFPSPPVKEVLAKAAKAPMFAARPTKVLGVKKNATPKPPHGPLTRPQMMLLAVAAGLVLAMILLAIYFTGTRMPGLLPDQEEAVAVETSTPTPTPTPTPTLVQTVGPLVPGVYQWDALLSGECLEPYVSPWEQEFTVVDCDTPHTAQLTKRATFPVKEGETVDFYPGAEELASRLTSLCTSTKVLNYKKSAVYTDVTLAATYATTAEEWAAGQHDYYCFVTRASGEPIVGTIARKPTAPKE